MARDKKCQKCGGIHRRVDVPNDRWRGMCAMCAENAEAIALSRRMQDIVDDEVRMPWEKRKFLTGNDRHPKA